MPCIDTFPIKTEYKGVEAEDPPPDILVRRLVPCYRIATSLPACACVLAGVGHQLHVRTLFNVFCEPCSVRQGIALLPLPHHFCAAVADGWVFFAMTVCSRLSTQHGS